jgi:hypothetical protein
VQLTIRIGNKPLRRQPGTPHITTRKTNARDVKLPNNASRYSFKTAIQDINTIPR